MKEEQTALIVSLHEEGKSQREIAELADCHHTTVGDRIKEYVGGKRHDAKIHQESDIECSPFFDEDECDTTPAINPKEAYSKCHDGKMNQDVRW